MSVVQPLDPAHFVTVPPSGGVPPYCSCGVVGGCGTHVDGKPLLADHIKEVNRAWTNDSR